MNFADQEVVSPETVAVSLEEGLLYGERGVGGLNGFVVVEADVAEVLREVSVDLSEEGVDVSEPAFDVVSEEVDCLCDFVLSVGFELPFDFGQFGFVEEPVGSVGSLCFVVEFEALVGRGEVE